MIFPYVFLQSNIILNINIETGDLYRLEMTTLMEAAADKITNTFRAHQGSFKMCSDFCHEGDGMLLFYKQQRSYQLHICFKNIWLPGTVQI